MDQTELVESVTSFVDLVLRLEASRPSRALPLWFRGQGTKAPQLKPAVLRDWFVRRAHGDATTVDPTQLSETELQLNRDFRRRGASLLPAAATLVDIYFSAQHHGLPTRLLDWTTNPLAALFFAVIGDPTSDGLVIVTVPDSRLSGEEPGNSDSPIRSAPLDMRSELVRHTIASLFGEGEPPEPALVLPVLPDLRAGRMLQQGSCFTLHMPGSSPIPEHAVLRLRVPRERKTAMQAELHALGTNWSTLFPDLDHLSRDLRLQWGCQDLDARQQ